MEAVRITTFSVPPGRRDEAIQLTRERLIPRMEAAEGFRGGYWLIDDGGDGIAVTLWDSEEDRARFGTEMREPLEASGAITGTTIRDMPLVASARGRAHA